MYAYVFLTYRSLRLEFHSVGYCLKSVGYLILPHEISILCFCGFPKHKLSVQEMSLFSVFEELFWGPCSAEQQK